MTKLNMELSEAEENKIRILKERFAFEKTPDLIRFLLSTAVKGDYVEK